MRLKGIGLGLAFILLLVGAHCTSAKDHRKDGDLSENLTELEKDGYQVPTELGDAAATKSVVERLELIGRHLRSLEDDGELRNYDGAAFLLQVKDRLAEADLDVFINPADTSPPGGPRPTPGSAAFTAQYAALRLPDGVLPRHCSFAGPNWTDFPEPPAEGRRVWACDACWNGRAPQDGVYVLYSDGTVELLSLRTIEGANRTTRTAHVGPHSPDPRLRTMCFEELR